MRDVGLAYAEALKEVNEVVIIDARLNEIYAKFSQYTEEEKKQRLDDFLRLLTDRTVRVDKINDCRYLLSQLVANLGNCEFKWLEKRNIDNRIKDMKKQIKNHIDFDMITQSYLDDIAKERTEQEKQDTKEEIQTKETVKK